MKKSYAEKGSIPGFGELWQPVGEKLQLFMIHIFDIEKVRPFIPKQFRIVSVLPGKTIGYIFNGYFGPKSTLEYHEFIVAPALVKSHRHMGFFISHMYVDNEKSEAGGKKMGLPKEMVTVKWAGRNSDQVDIQKNNQPLISIAYRKRWGRAGFTGRANVISLIGNKVFFCRNHLRADWSLCSAAYSFPCENNLSKDLAMMDPGKPVFAMAGKNMHGEMGIDQQIIGSVPTPC